MMMEKREEMARPSNPGPGHPLWDLPTRVFHWLTVIALPLAWWSAEADKLDLHQWIGMTLLVLVITRVVWGVVGSRHSRFSDFLVGPRRMLDYVRGHADSGAGQPGAGHTRPGHSGPGHAGPGHARPGHNPLGGWSVIAMIVLLLLQAVSGLFNSDDVFFSGPLYTVASTEVRGAMGVIHQQAFNLLCGLLILHISAVLYHQLVRGENLVQAMWWGRAEGRTGRESPVPWWWALLLFVLLFLLLWWGLEQVPQPAPMW